MDNKRGSFSIYACLFLMVLMASAGLFLGAAKKSAVMGTGRAAASLWSQSILAEYDQNLQSRYHIFGYYGYPAMVMEKLTFYGEETFGEKESVECSILSCSLYEHSLRNVDTFEGQIINAGKIAVTDAFHQPAKSIKSVTHHQIPAHEVLFSDLPSEGSKTGLSMSSLLQNYQGNSSLKSLAKKGTDTWFQLSYVFSHFKDLQNKRDLGKTYLQSEVEYIIAGKQTDADNEKAVKRRIIALREPVNLAYLERNGEKKAAVYAAAELLTPGAAAVTAQSILVAWAYAESVNDYNLLIRGHSVSKTKTDKSWATDLESVLEADGEDGCIYTGVESGDTYEEYLRLLLVTMNGSTRLLRMMDVIQINMRYCYYDTFLLEDYYGGVSFTYSVNGETCHVDESYE